MLVLLALLALLTVALLLLPPLPPDRFPATELRPVPTLPNTLAAELDDEAGAAVDAPVVVLTVT